MSEPPVEIVDGEVTAVVDVHEPDEIRFGLLDHPDVGKWTEAALDAADIVVNGVGFERKTPSDFASSLLEGRLDEQVQKLADAYDDAYILLSGGFDDFDSLSHTRLNPQAARGKAASITARHGIPVIPTDTEALLIDHATRLGRKHTEAPTSAHLPTGALGSDAPPGKQMWACLPGVGPALAERLFAEFGSPGVFARDYGAGGINRLADVDGIGTTTAREIFVALMEVTDDD